MKVWQLKKINEYAKDNKIRLDYKCLLKIDMVDIDRIIALIDKNNKNIKDVIDFIIWDLNNTNWTDDFQHLEGIENFDIREYLIKQIVNAPSQCISNLIIKHFNGNDMLLKNFDTIEEWKTYIENIKETFKDRKNITLSNILFILDNKQDNDDSCKLIKQVMEYSQIGILETKTLASYFDKRLTPYLSKIMSLLAKNYDVLETIQIFENWMTDIEDDNDNSKDIIDKCYQNVITYLEECKLEDDVILPVIFNVAKYEEYGAIISLLKSIEEEEDKELYEECSDNYYVFNNEFMRNYIINILNAQKNIDYRESLLYLLNQKVLADFEFYESKDNIERALNAILLSQENDKTSMEMAKFIASIRHIEIIKNMKITKDNLDTRRILYNDFPKFIEKGVISENKIENYTDWLKKLSYLEPDICQKVMDIINISLIKNMDLNSQNQIKELVLDPENFGSLDYIYTKYKEKEEEYNLIKNTTQVDSNKTQPTYDPKVKLTTVLELLECDHDIDRVLEGFDSDDEITEKTLIRI